MGFALEKPSQIEACVVAQDLVHFAHLAEDLGAEFGFAWGEMEFANALACLKSPAGDALKFVTLAIGKADEQDLPVISKLIARAKSRKTKVILIVEDVSTAALHLLLRQGADGFVPYPIPDGALGELVAKLTRPSGPTLVVNNQTGQPSRHGAIIPVYGLAGGVGATSVAVNLAWEIARMGQSAGTKTLILDLDLQFGSVSTYLNLPRREAIFDLLSDVAAMDRDAFTSVVQPFHETLDVFTAPADALPLEMLEVQDVDKLLDMASCVFDFVILDMPKTLVSWAERLITRADILLAILDKDLRSAENSVRFIRTLEAEELPLDKVKYILNRAPKFTDRGSRARLRRMAENVGFEFCAMLPEGGPQVVKACDLGLPLAETAQKNPLRKGIVKLADEIYHRQRTRMVGQR